MYIATSWGYPNIAPLSGNHKNIRWVEGNDFVMLSQFSVKLHAPNWNFKKNSRYQIDIAIIWGWDFFNISIRCRYVTAPAYYLLIRSLSFPEHLNVTIRLGSSIKSLFVVGLRPLRCLLCFSWNLSKPDIMTSSPDSRDCLMISSRISVTSVDCFRE